MGGDKVEREERRAERECVCAYGKGARRDKRGHQVGGGGGDVHQAERWTCSKV